MKEETHVKVRTLLENFEFEQICGDDRSLNRPIVIPDTNRPGLELAGYFENSQVKRLVILGDKEIAYIETLSSAKKKRAFEFITNDLTPAIIVTKGHVCPLLLIEIAKKKNFPIFLSQSPSYRLIVDMVAYLDELLATSIGIHGGLLSIHGLGVLISGESGLGKSEIALELVKRGHLLVADDRVDCYRIHNKIFGQAPELLKEMLEIRGIGVINVTRMFGVSSVLAKTQIDFIVHLETWKADQDYDRVGIEDRKVENILGIDIPKIIVPVREGRSMAVIIESAVTNFMLSQLGLDSAKEFEQRVLDYIALNKKKM